MILYCMTANVLMTVGSVIRAVTAWWSGSAGSFWPPSQKTPSSWPEEICLETPCATYTTARACGLMYAWWTRRSELWLLHCPAFKSKHFPLKFFFIIYIKCKNVVLLWAPEFQMSKQRSLWKWLNCRSEILNSLSFMLYAEKLYVWCIWKGRLLDSQKKQQKAQIFWWKRRLPYKDVYTFGLW